MAVQVEAYRTPEELSTDLGELSSVDWGLVWAGLSGRDPIQWCAQFGWRLEHINRVEDLDARLESGGMLHIRQARNSPYPPPVTWVQSDAWSATASTGADNDDLFAAADEWWPRYLAAAGRVLGDPIVSTTWDDPAFPASSRWPRPEDRLGERRPYRFASWSLSGALFELDASPSGSAVSHVAPGRILLGLAVRPIEAGA